MIGSGNYTELLSGNEKTLNEFITRDLKPDLQIFFVSLFTKFIGHVLMVYGIAKPGDSSERVGKDLIWIAPIVALTALFANDLALSKIEYFRKPPRDHFFDNSQIAGKFFLGLIGFVVSFCPTRSLWVGMGGMGAGLFTAQTIINVAAEYRQIRSRQNQVEMVAFKLVEVYARPTNSVRGINAYSLKADENDVRLHFEEGIVFRGTKQPPGIEQPPYGLAAQESSALLLGQDLNPGFVAILLGAAKDALPILAKGAMEALFWGLLLNWGPEEYQPFEDFCDDEPVRLILLSSSIVSAGASTGFPLGGLLINMSRWVVPKIKDCCVQSVSSCCSTLFNWCRPGQVREKVVSPSHATRLVSGGNGV